MKDQKEVKAKGNLLLIVLLLIVIIVAIVVSTGAWSKYIQEQETSSQASVAGWYVTMESDNVTLSKTYEHIIDDQKIAPGTNGTIPITIDTHSQTDVDVKYTVYILGVENKPENLFFYGTSKDSKIEVKQYVSEGENQPVQAVSGTIKAGTATTEGAINWEWPFYTSDSDDAEDLKDGQAHKDMIVHLKIVAEQIQPE